MTTEAGQLFAMMRSFSAAEIAQRFNTGEGWAMTTTAGVAGGTAADTGAGSARASGAGNSPNVQTSTSQTATGSTPGATQTQISSGSLATPTPGQQSAPKSVSPTQHGLAADGIASSTAPGTTRPDAQSLPTLHRQMVSAQPAAFSMAHLAAPRLMIAPQAGNALLPGLVAGQTIAPGETQTVATGTAAKTTVHTATGMAATGMAAHSNTMPAATVAAGTTVESGATGQSGVTQGTQIKPSATASVAAQAQAATAADANRPGDAVRATARNTQNSISAAGGGLAAQSGTTTQTASTGVGQVAPLVVANQEAQSQSIAQARNALLAAQSQPPSTMGSTAVPDKTAAASVKGEEVSLVQTKQSSQQTSVQAQATAGIPISATTQSVSGQGNAIPVLAEAVAIALENTAAGKGQAQSVASGVIFNAAMMPGWPFPTALVRDSAVSINDKALLHKLAAQVERMTPEEAAEYLAKIGAGHVLLRKLRELLKEIEGIDKEDVKGLLSAFLSVINSVAESIQILIDQMNEMAELQESVVHADKEGRSNRRRFKL